LNQLRSALPPFIETALTVAVGHVPRQKIPPSVTEGQQRGQIPALRSVARYWFAMPISGEPGSTVRTSSSWRRASFT